LWADCTPLGQTCWPDKWRQNSSSTTATPQLYKVLGWSSLCGGKVAQPHTGENKNTFRSELKLTAFPEKNILPNSSILAPRLPCRQEGWLLLTHQLFTGPLQGTCLFKQADTDCPPCVEPPPKLLLEKGTIDYYRA
jgi:hypothetical protein